MAQIAMTTVSSCKPTAAKVVASASTNAQVLQWLGCVPSIAIVSYAMKVRTEGTGVRATGRAFDKSHSTILRWEQRLADQEAAWSPPAPENTDITLEGDELYTRVGENLPPRTV